MSRCLRELYRIDTDRYRHIRYSDPISDHKLILPEGRKEGRREAATAVARVNISTSDRDPGRPSLITQSTQLSRPAIVYACWQTCLANTRAIHAGRFSGATLPRASLYIRMSGGGYWWRWRRRRCRCRSIPMRLRLQMVRRLQLHASASINYYQAVCHSHETINSVAPVHRRADKLSRSMRSHPRHSPLPHPLIYIYIYIYFLWPIYRWTSVTLFNGRPFNGNFPDPTDHSSYRRDSDTQSMIYSFWQASSNRIGFVRLAKCQNISINLEIP